MAWALAAVAAVSALGNVSSLLVVSATMGQAAPPDSPATFLPVLAGVLIGLLGDGLLLSGAGAMLRPGLRFTTGRGSVTAGLVLQLVAAAAVGTLESSWVITGLYVVLLAALIVLWLRLAPAAAPRPVAQHPEEGRRRRPVVTRTGRWTVPGANQPIEWGGGVPLPPSAPAQKVVVDDPEPRRSGSATWNRP
ncbi:MAG: hypothetical protein ACYDC5_01510 [Candidatus Dormibacteria bacterium]